jgi:hypothetical protein
LTELGFVGIAVDEPVLRQLLGAVSFVTCRRRVRREGPTAPTS